MQDLLEAVNRHAASVGIMRNNASKTKVISVLITGEQRLAAMLDGEQLDESCPFRILWPAILSRREISLRI